MIPKIIHYCWFGGNPLPEEARRFITGWREKCPDYTIKEWNESNFDVNAIPYVREAYEARKWAFVTDYVRLFALYNEGGIYMDTDVEVLKNLDRFLSDEAFSGFEDEKNVPTGIMGSKAGQKAVKDMMDAYKDRHFIDSEGNMDMRTNSEVITDYFIRSGLVLNNKKQTVNGFTMYPIDYFCPKNSRTLEIMVTENSYTIHHFSGTWTNGETNFRRKIKKILGPKLCTVVVKIMDALHIK